MEKLLEEARTTILPQMSYSLPLAVNPQGGCTPENNRGLSITQNSVANLPPLIELVVKRLAHSLNQEFQVSWQFIRGDLSATVIPATLFFLAGWYSQGRSFDGLLSALGQCILYFWLYIYCFCLSNQFVGIEEDRLNKPYRPLVRGIVSPRGALLRWAIAMILFTLIGVWLHVLFWTLLWQVALVLHNWYGWAKHWLGKGLPMAAGVVAQLTVAWHIAAPLTETAWHWILFFTGAVFLLVPLQDLRDLAGDRRVNRLTLPLMIGENRTRWLLLIGFLLQPFLVHFLLFLPVRGYWSVYLCSGALAITSWIIAVRLMVFRTAQCDHKTYMLYTYWCCLALASALVIL